MGTKYAVRLFIIIIIFTSVACNSIIVRDADTYRSELALLDIFNQQVVVDNLKILEEKCQCEIDDGELKFVSLTCRKLAYDTLFIKQHINYHIKYMQYLGRGWHEKGIRPKGMPMDIGDVNRLCKKHR